MALEPQWDDGVCGGLGLLDEQNVGNPVLPPIAAALDIAKAVP
jgi:hypothetical protein